jgi:hypothetical protein
MINGQTVQVSTTRFELVASNPGEAVLGPALLIYEDEQGKRKQIKSNEIHVTVVPKTGFSLFGKKTEPPTPSAPPQTTPSVDDLRAIKGLPPEFPWLRLIFWSAVLILAAGFIWRKLVKAGKKPTQAVPPGKAAELRVALKKLDDDMPSKEFCLGLSNIVRECLQFRFGFPAVDCTSEEISRELSKLKLSEEDKAATEKCLRTCDRFLYADGNLTGRDALRTACSLLLPKGPKN